MRAARVPTYGLTPFSFLATGHGSQPPKHYKNAKGRGYKQVGFCMVLHRGALWCPKLPVGLVIVVPPAHGSIAQLYPFPRMRPFHVAVEKNHVSPSIMHRTDDTCVPNGAVRQIE